MTKLLTYGSHNIYTLYGNFRSDSVAGLLLFFYHIQHFDGSFDSRLCLVSIQASSSEYLSFETPSNNGLHKGISPSAWWDCYRIVGQHRELPPQRLLIDFPQGTNECIILTVTARTFFVFFPVDFNLQESSGLPSVSSHRPD